ncbi:MAG: SDR family oxidoreductase [Clostridiales bacterium]|nr:SDR family oxidoreductase [Clostridiales bacterium]
MNTDKTALVTGASSGIGRAIARMLKDLGYEVLGIGREFKEREDFEMMVCDLTSEEQFSEKAVTVIKERQPDILVNCAGVGFYGLHENISPEDIRSLVRTDLEVPLLLTSYVLPYMKQKKSGTIINICSVTSREVNTYGAAYGACKAGLLSFSRSIFEEARKHGIRVIDVLPDMTDTALYRNADFGCCEEPGCALDPSDVAEALKDALSAREGTLVREITIVPQYRRIGRKKDSQ